MSVSLVKRQDRLSNRIRLLQQRLARVEHNNDAYKTKFEELFARMEASEKQLLQYQYIIKFLGNRCEYFQDSEDLVFKHLKELNKRQESLTKSHNTNFTHFMNSINCLMYLQQNTNNVQ